MNLAHAVLATVVVGSGFYGFYGFYVVAQADRKLKRIKVRVEKKPKR